MYILVSITESITNLAKQIFIYPMEQRDYLLRQIQQMAQALVALIRKLTGLKEESSEEEVQQTTNEMLKEQFNMELQDVMHLPVEEVADWIIEKKGLHKDNIELFADVLKLNAEARSNIHDKQKLLEAALGLYSYADKTGDTFSIERHKKMNEIKVLLEEG